MPEWIEVLYCKYSLYFEIQGGGRREHMCVVPPVYIRYYARHFRHGTTFNPHKNLMRQRQMLLLSSFYRKGNLREGKEFVQSCSAGK